MTGGARPAAGLPAAGQHEAAARPGDTAAGQAAVPAGGRARTASRRGRPWMRALAAAAAVAAAAVRAPAAASDLRAAFAHAGGLRVSWLGVAVAAEVMSLAGGAAAQRRLLSAAGVSLPWRTVSGAVFASTGLARVMPAGPAAGGAWQAAEYRRRGAGAAAGLWAVLAGGYTSTVAVSALLLAGAAVAGTGCLPLLAGAAGVLAAGTAGLTAAAPRRGAQPVAEPASSPFPHNRPAGCGRGRVVTPGRRVRLGRCGAGLHRRGSARRRGPARRLFRAGRAAGAVARAAVRLRRRAAGRPARPAARRARRRGRRRARRAHPHRHPARSGGSRGHHLPGGRVLGRRRRRDRGGGHPHPPPQPRTGGEAPQQPAGRNDQGQDGVPALAAPAGPARTTRAAGQRPRPRGPASPPARRPGPKPDPAGRRSPEPGTQGPGHSPPRIPRVPETRKHRWH
jgi:hypothetical protein